MSANLTTLEPVLKVNYGGPQLKHISYDDRPLYAMLKKHENFGGRYKPLPIKFGASQNRAVDFTYADRSNALVSGFGTSAAQFEEFLLRRKKNYATGKIDGETIMASRGDLNAFVTAVKSEFESVIESISDDVHQALYNSNTGARCVAASVAAGSGTTDVVTVTNKEDLHRIEPNMLLTHATSEDGALLNSGEARLVSAVDRQAGTFTLATAFTTAVAADDWFFVAGDRPVGALASNPATRYNGLSAWLPATVASDDDFLGVNRSVDRDKLAGIYVDGSSLTIQEALLKGATGVTRYGGKTSHVFLNHTDLMNLINELGTRVEYDVAKTPDGIMGFEAVKLRTTKGVVPVIGDHQCPVGNAFMLDMRTWGLHSAGPCIQILNLDGNRMLRADGEDAYKFRYGGYAELGCNAPGRNARVVLPSAA